MMRLLALKVTLSQPYVGADKRTISYTFSFCAFSFGKIKKGHHTLNTEYFCHYSATLTTSTCGEIQNLNCPAKLRSIICVSHSLFGGGLSMAFWEM